MRLYLDDFPFLLVPGDDPEAWLTWIAEQMHDGAISRLKDADGESFVVNWATVRRARVRFHDAKRRPAAVDNF